MIVVGASWKQYYNRQLWLAQNHPTLAAFCCSDVKLLSLQGRRGKAEEQCLENFFSGSHGARSIFKHQTHHFDPGTMFFWWVRRRQFFCFKDAYRRNYIFSVERKDDRELIKIEAEKCSTLLDEAEVCGNYDDGFLNYWFNVFTFFKKR